MGRKKSEVIEPRVTTAETNGHEPVGEYLVNLLARWSDRRGLDSQVESLRSEIPNWRVNKPNATTVTMWRDRIYAAFDYELKKATFHPFPKQTPRKFQPWAFAVEVKGHIFLASQVPPETLQNGTVAIVGDDNWEKCLKAASEISAVGIDADDSTVRELCQKHDLPLWARDGAIYLLIVSGGDGKNPIRALRVYNSRPSARLYSNRWDNQLRARQDFEVSRSVGSFSASIQHYGVKLQYITGCETPGDARVLITKFVQGLGGGFVVEVSPDAPRRIAEVRPQTPGEVEANMDRERRAVEQQFLKEDEFNKIYGSRRKAAFREGAA